MAVTYETDPDRDPRDRPGRTYYGEGRSQWF
jgi:hypothetical protein